RNFLPALRLFAGELPCDRGRGQHFHDGVQAEPDQGGGGRDSTGPHRNDGFDDVVRDRESDDEADATMQRGTTLSGQWHAHAVAPVPQQPGTVHESSRHGAFSSTARVTSTSAVSAAARCGSAISYRVCRPSGSATTIPQSRRHVRWLETFDRDSSNPRESTAG